MFDGFKCFQMCLYIYILVGITHVNTGSPDQGNPDSTNGGKCFLISWFFLPSIIHPGLFSGLYSVPACSGLKADQLQDRHIKTLKFCSSTSAWKIQLRIKAQLLPSIPIRSNIPEYKYEKSQTAALRLVTMHCFPVLSLANVILKINTLKRKPLLLLLLVLVLRCMEFCVRLVLVVLPYSSRKCYWTAVGKINVKYFTVYSFITFYYIKMWELWELHRLDLTLNVAVLRAGSMLAC